MEKDDLNPIKKANRGKEKPKEAAHTFYLIVELKGIFFKWEI